MNGTPHRPLHPSLASMPTASAPQIQRSPSTLANEVRTSARMTSQNGTAAVIGSNTIRRSALLHQTVHRHATTDLRNMKRSRLRSLSTGVNKPRSASTKKPAGSVRPSVDDPAAPNQ